MRGFPRLGVDLFIEKASKGLEGIHVLDAGAGDQRYAKHFSLCMYESCDHPGMEFNICDRHSFYCDLIEIPRPANHYDLILCSQVLEHVPEPARIIKELYRILKPGGQLILTVPQCSGLHMVPYNYFNFLEYGLRFLCETSGFKALKICPLGGIFFLLGKCVDQVFLVLLERIIPSSNAKSYIHKIFLYLMIPVNLLLYLLDKLDLEKKWTLNYGLIAIKPT